MITISNHRDSITLNEDAAVLLNNLITIGWRISISIPGVLEAMGTDEAVGATCRLDTVANILCGLTADGSKMEVEGDPA